MYTYQPRIQIDENIYIITLVAQRIPSGWNGSGVKSMWYCCWECPKWSRELIAFSVPSHDAEHARHAQRLV